MLTRLQNMGVIDRILRTLMGAALVYISVIHSDIIGNTLLNVIVGVFGATNIIASAVRICPAYLLVGFSTAGRVKYGQCRYVQEDEKNDSIEHSGKRHNIAEAQDLGALRHKLQLSVALPMLALLGIFGTIVLDLNYQFQLSHFTRKQDVATGLVASLIQAQVKSLGSSSTTQTPEPSAANSGAAQDANRNAASSASTSADTQQDVSIRTAIRQAPPLPQAVYDETALFFLHDSLGNRLASPYDHGLDRLKLQLAFIEAFQRSGSKKHSRGSIHLGKTDYLWTSRQIGESDVYVSAAMAEPGYGGMLEQFTSTRFLVIIMAVMWLALWSSTYIVRTFVAKIRDSATEIEYRTRHDVLTGLPNRLHVLDIIRERIQQLDTDTERLALLMVDIISFREINDTLGYSLGDQLLVKVGNELAQIDSGKTIAVRMGGDVFGLVCKTGAEESSASRLANRVHDQLERGQELDGVPIALQVRIGVSTYPQHAQSAEDLIRNADIALAQATSQRFKTSFYQQEADTHSIRKLALLSRLRSVIEQDQLTLVYQPKINIQDQRIVGVEVLVRWHDEEFGHVSPVEFINWAEKSGLINKLTRWVLRAADKQRGEWLAKGHDISLAVNLSPTNLSDPKLIPLVRRLIESSQLGNSRLELEITENAVMENPENALRTMNKIHRLGASFAIDDFGTGLSSFTYLRKFPVSNLKIDRAFISEGNENDRDAVLLQSMIELGHSLGCVVTAEGVEDKDSLERLRDYGCDTIQGYYVCRPLPADEFIEWLEKSEWSEARKAA